MAKITKKTTGLSIGTILKAINIKENTPFILNKFYRITDGDGVGALFVGGYSDIELTMHELGDYFEHIETLDDIVDLESKVLLIKQIFKQFKELSEDSGEEIIEEALINESIAFIAQDEVYQGDEIELRFICDKMNITMVEQCSCCGKTLMPDDECYEDDLNDGAALCDHCSIFNEETDMYQKTVHQDVIEKITGLKFSPHIGNIGSTVEEFNHWLNRYKLAFSYSEESSKQNFIDFINGCTEFNICDCCGLIEKSSELYWIIDDDKTTQFIARALDAHAVCNECYNVFKNRPLIDLSIIVQRIKENSMIYRVGDLVVIEKINDKKRFDYIESFDESTKTYKLIGFPEKTFKEEDFFDAANEAYIVEYTNFIENNYSELIDDINDYKSDYKSFDAEQLIESIGHQDEFIEYLITNNLPYSRLLTHKFKIGDKFTIHFDYYEKGEVTTHTIARIDKSFTEANEIVYWSDDYVFITESELEKQKALLNEEFDEVQIIKDDLLHNLFCLEEENGIVVPTFTELEKAKEILPKWKLCEKYEDYSYDSIIHEINEQCENFFIALEALETAKEKHKKSKKYGFRQRVEFGSPIELVCELQEMHNIYSNGVINPETELVLLQDSRNTEDYSSIEILLQTPIKYDELSSHLKSTLDSEYHAEVDMLLEAIKEAKADKHETFLVYDC